MELILESPAIQDYLKPDKYIDFHADVIIQKANKLFNSLTEETAKIKAAFEFVRDEISHSGDIESERVTKIASEALIYGEGICVAKSLLLAALLRRVCVIKGLHGEIRRTQDMLYMD